MTSEQFPPLPAGALPLRIQGICPTCQHDVHFVPADAGYAPPVQPPAGSQTQPWGYSVGGCDYCGQSYCITASGQRTA